MNIEKRIAVFQKWSGDLSPNNGIGMGLNAYANHFEWHLGPKRNVIRSWVWDSGKRIDSYEAVTPMEIEKFLHQDIECVFCGLGVDTTEIENALQDAGVTSLSKQYRIRKGLGGYDVYCHFPILPRIKKYDKNGQANNSRRY